MALKYTQINDMNKTEILERLSAGQLVGDLINQMISAEINIVRHYCTKENKSMLYDNSIFKLLHSTEAFLSNIYVGKAKTYFYGDWSEWSRLKNIRMNKVLNNFGWQIIDFNYNPISHIIYRTIKSKSNLSSLLIFEEISLKKILSTINSIKNAN